MIQILYSRGLRRVEGPVTEEGPDSFDYERRKDDFIVFATNLNKGDIIVQETHGPNGYFREETWRVPEVIKHGTPFRLKDLSLHAKGESPETPIVI
jgi:hypothetical protein